MENSNDKKIIIVKSLWKSLKEGSITGEKTSLNLIKNLKEKRSEIKRLVNQNLFENEKCNRNLKRKPSPLLRMEKGMKKYFFGERGLVTKKSPILRNEYRRANVDRQLRLTTRIRTGALTSLDIMNNNHHKNQHSNAAKKDIIRKSMNFCVIPAFEKLRHCHHLSILAKTPNCVKHAKPNTFSEGLIEKKSRNVLKTHCQTNSTDRNDPRVQYLFDFEPFEEINRNNNKTSRTKHSFAFSYRSISETQNSIMNKCKLIGQKYEKLEKAMFKNLYSLKGKIPEKHQVNAVDVEAIFGTKFEEKPKTDDRKDFLAMIQLKGPYKEIKDPLKANMIKLADTINRMNDEAALRIADRIVDIYEDNAREAGMPTDLHHLRIKKKIVKLSSDDKLRLKTEENDHKLKRLQFSIDQVKNKIYQQMAGYWSDKTEQSER